MLLVIFGAGASYDSDPRLRPSSHHRAEDKWRPPLTDALFANREEFREFTTDFPRILPLVAQLGHVSAGEPLEAILSRLADEVSDYPLRRSELAAVRYYLQRLIWECERYWHPERKAVTNYLGLLDRIERWRKGESNNVVFVTFNCDRLFEFAASYYMSDAKKIYNNEYTSLDVYVQQPRFPLVKLHGSIDWGYRINTHLEVVQESSACLVDSVGRHRPVRRSRHFS
jgi:hypothetical protein